MISALCTLKLTTWCNVSARTRCDLYECTFSAWFIIHKRFWYAYELDIKKARKKERKKQHFRGRQLVGNHLTWLTVDTSQATLMKDSNTHNRGFWICVLCNCSTQTGNSNDKAYYMNISCRDFSNKDIDIILLSPLKCNTKASQQAVVRYCAKKQMLNP